MINGISTERVDCTFCLISNDNGKLLSPLGSMVNLCGYSRHSNAQGFHLSSHRSMGSYGNQANV